MSIELKELSKKSKSVCLPIYENEIGKIFPQPDSNDVQGEHEIEEIFPQPNNNVVKEKISEVLNFLLKDWSYLSLNNPSKGYDLIQKSIELRTREINLTKELLTILSQDEMSIYHHHIYVVIIILFYEEINRIQYIFKCSQSPGIGVIKEKVERQFPMTFIRQIEGTDESLVFDYKNSLELEKCVSNLSNHYIIIDQQPKDFKSSYKFYDEKEKHKFLIKIRDMSVGEEKMEIKRQNVKNVENRKKLTLKVTDKRIEIIKMRYSDHFFVIDESENLLILTFKSETQLKNFKEKYSLSSEKTQTASENCKLEISNEDLIKSITTNENYLSYRKIDSIIQLDFNYTDNNTLENIGPFYFYDNSDISQVTLEFFSESSMKHFNEKFIKEHKSILMEEIESSILDDKEEEEDVDKLISNINNERYKKNIHLLYHQFVEEKSTCDKSFDKFIMDLLDDLDNQEQMHQMNFQIKLSKIINKEVKKVGSFHKFTLRDEMTILNEKAWENKMESVVEHLYNLYPHIGEKETLVTNVFKERNNIFDTTYNDVMNKLKVKTISLGEHGENWLNDVS